MLRKELSGKRAAALRKNPRQGGAVQRNSVGTDARKTAKLADGNTAKKNFNIFYEIDGEEVGSVLRADEYGGDEDFSWVLLEPAEGA